MSFDARGRELLGVLTLIGLVFPLGGIAVSFWAYLRTRRALLASVGIALSIAAVAYFYRTTEVADVYRHIEWLALYEHVPLHKAFDAGHYHYLYLWDVLSWTVAHIGNPYLLQASVAFIAYAIISYVVLDCGNRVNARTASVLAVWILVFCAVPILGIFSGMRNSLAALICALAIYREVMQRRSRKSSLLLFICALLIHRASIVIFVLWLVFPFIKRLNRTAIILTFLGAASVTMLAPLLLDQLQGASGLFSSILADALGSSISAGTANSWSELQASSLNTRVNNLVSFVMILLLMAKTIGMSRKLPVPSGPETNHERISGQEGIQGLFSYFLILASASMGLMVSFVVEGDRLLAIVYLLGFTAYLGMRQLTRVKSTTLDHLVVVTAAVLLLLHIYSLIYGLETEMVWTLVKAVLFVPLGLYV